MSPRLPIRLLAAQSDQRLAALVAQGHERAFEALVHRYRRPLLRYCRRMGLSDSRAEDVLQQSLLKAWQALSEGGQVRELRPWLYRIVHNATVNAMTRGGQPHVELSDAVAAPDADPGARLAAREALGEVARLPDLQRDALVMSAIAGCDHDEVASALGVSNGAVRGLLYRARTTLRSAAAALTPQGLLGWIARGEAVPGAERPAELAAGAAGAGMASGLIKGALLAATAGVLATGAAVVHDRSAHHARPVRAKASTSAAVRPAVDVQAPSPQARPAAGAGSRAPAHGPLSRRRLDVRARLVAPVTSPAVAPVFGGRDRRRSSDLPSRQDETGAGPGSDREQTTSSHDGEQRTAAGDGGSFERGGSESDGAGQTPSAEDASSKDGGSDGSGDGSPAHQSPTTSSGGGASPQTTTTTASPPPSGSQAELGH